MRNRRDARVVVPCSGPREVMADRTNADPTPPYLGGQEGVAQSIMRARNQLITDGHKGTSSPDAAIPDECPLSVWKERPPRVETCPLLAAARAENRTLEKSVQRRQVIDLVAPSRASAWGFRNRVPSPVIGLHASIATLALG